MADINKIKERIRELATRRKNVRLSEIEWIVNSLEAHGFKKRTRNNGHQTKFTVGGRSFGVCTHHSGTSQVLPVYVDAFIDVMIDLGLYDNEE